MKVKLGKFGDLPFHECFFFFFVFLFMIDIKLQDYTKNKKDKTKTRHGLLVRQVR